ncbi:hypothetical protein [Nannocystis pusilla]|uniref:hypothetical protein n=1 Tax=Nannocystis pusilla TaxID=889268 RepID=UPI003DA45615
MDRAAARQALVDRKRVLRRLEGDDPVVGVGAVLAHPVLTGLAELAEDAAEEAEERGVEHHVDARRVHREGAVDELQRAVAHVPPRGRVHARGRAGGEHAPQGLEVVALLVREQEGEVHVAGVVDPAGAVQVGDRGRRGEVAEREHVAEEEVVIGERAAAAEHEAEAGAVVRGADAAGVAALTGDADLAGPGAVRLAQVGEELREATRAAIREVGILAGQRIGVRRRSEGRAVALRDQFVEVVGPRLEAPDLPQLVVLGGGEGGDAEAGRDVLRLGAREQRAGADRARGEQGAAPLGALAQLAAIPGRSDLLYELGIDVAILPEGVEGDGPAVADARLDHGPRVLGQDGVVRLALTEVPQGPAAVAAP